MPKCMVMTGAKSSDYYLKDKIYLVLKFQYRNKVFINKLADLHINFLVHKEYLLFVQLSNFAWCPVERLHSLS